MVKSVNISFYLLIFAVVFSCDKYGVFEKVVEVQNSEWEADTKYDFNFTISDTTLSYDLLIHFRNSKHYMYSNVWLFIQTTSPSGTVQRDTLEIILANQAGRWMGQGIGDVNAILVPYKVNVLFPIRGIYNISLQHAMREEKLEHVLDIGLRVQYHK
ncbi:MAG: gliding motility lipoprotein GldH [Bacteroidales bacterium]|nr:gliding motility lipoprotein GldH [Bacteroidales bacterium]